MKKYNVGIIGCGFVGESQAFAFSPTAHIYIYDIDPLRSLNTLDEVLNCDFVFVCVPTPMYEDGTQDLRFIEDVFNKAKKGPVYIIKSTILPGTTKKIQSDFLDLDIIFSPEFLTERTSKLDMITQARVVLGGDRELTKKVENLFKIRFKSRHYIHTDSNTAEYIKYMNNTFFAAKVSIMNEFYRLSKKVNVDWETALYGFAADQRVGDSHLHVPGPDGKLGFGGACFPKDINALIKLSELHGVKMNILEAAWKTNLEVRPEEDWKNLKGRAVS
jgi:UDPglucose 6-dehydrogenase